MNGTTLNFDQNPPSSRTVTRREIVHPQQIKHDATTHHKSREEMIKQEHYGISVEEPGLTEGIKDDFDSLNASDFFSRNSKEELESDQNNPSQQVKIVQKNQPDDKIFEVQKYNPYSPKSAHASPYTNDGVVRPSPEFPTAFKTDTPKLENPYVQKQEIRTIHESPSTQRERRSPLSIYQNVQEQRTVEPSVRESENTIDYQTKIITHDNSPQNEIMFEDFRSKVHKEYTPQRSTQTVRRERNGTICVEVEKPQEDSSEFNQAMENMQPVSTTQALHVPGQRADQEQTTLDSYKMSTGHHGAVSFANSRVELPREVKQPNHTLTNVYTPKLGSTTQQYSPNIEVTKGLGDYLAGQIQTNNKLDLSPTSPDPYSEAVNTTVPSDYAESDKKVLPAPQIVTKDEEEDEISKILARNQEFMRKMKGQIDQNRQKTQMVTPTTTKEQPQGNIRLGTFGPSTGTRTVNYSPQVAIQKPSAKTNYLITAKSTYADYVTNTSGKDLMSFSEFEKERKQAVSIQTHLDYFHKF